MRDFSFLARTKIARVMEREFWLNGRLSSPCCPLFLRSARDESWEVFYNDEHYRFDCVPLDGPFPEHAAQMGFDEFLWRDREPDGASLLVNQPIAKAEAFETKDEAQFILTMETGALFLIAHRFDTDRSRYWITVRD